MKTSDAGPAEESGGLREQYEVERTLQEVRAGGYRRVALQFPDALLPDAPAVCRLLTMTAVIQAQAGEEQAQAPFFFIIGDTSYGSCCVDEVAAQHLLADCIVHYGPACLSPTARLPVIHVFGWKPLPDPQAAAASITSALRDPPGDDASNPVRRALLFYDLAYAHAAPELGRLLQAQVEGDGVDVVVARLPRAPPMPAPAVAVGGGCCGQGDGSCAPVATQQPAVGEGAEALPQQEQQERGPRTVIAGGLEVVVGDDGGEKGERQQEEGRRTVVVYIGPAGGKQLATIMLRFNALGDCVVYDPAEENTKARCEALATQRELKRRYYMVQRARDAQVLGIVVGTLGVARYLRVVASVRRLIERAGKKAYTLVVGKLNPAKLANFAEIEAFVLVACPESSLLPEGGRDFHAPIVTPLELEMALGGRAWDGFYSTDFRDLESLFAKAAQEGDDKQDEEEEDDTPYYSLVSGGFKGHSATSGTAAPATSNVGGGQLLAYHSPAAEFLQLREYRGLGHDKPVGEEGDGEGEQGGQKPPAGIVEGRRGIAADYGGF